MAKQEKEKKTIDSVLQSINKRYGEGTLMALGSNQKAFVKTITTGSMAIDDALGGGYAVGRLVELFSEPSVGKAQRMSSKVLTPSGWKTIGTLKEGDIICTPDGGDSTVIGLFPQGVKDVYRITFDDKTYTDATLDHLWEVSNSKSTFVATTGELLEEGLVTADGARKFKIPVMKPCKFNEQPLSIDPYLLGVMLAEGCISKTQVTFTTVDEFVLNKVKQIVKRDYPTLVVAPVSSKQENCISYRIRNQLGRKGSLKNPLLDAFRKLGLAGARSYEKFIPKEYIFNSVENRLLLLQSLIDTDGSVGTNGAISYTTTSKQLSLDFEELCRSLAYRVFTSSRITKYTNGAGVKVCGRRSYRSHILSTVPEFVEATTPAKATRLRKTLSTFTRRYIEKIEHVGTDECQCILIGHPDHLYITDDFIVTHNTTVSATAIAEVQKTGGKVAYIDTENSVDAKYFEALGVNIKELLFTQPDSAEAACQILLDLLDTGEFSLIVVDSIAAMIPQKIFEADAGEATMAVLARILSQEMPKIASKAMDSNCTVIFTNQVRNMIGGYGGGVTTPGGQAMKFYASQRIHLFKGTSAEDHGEKVGNNSWCRVVKNKIAPPMREAKFTIKFGKGLDRMQELLDYAVDYGIIQKGGSWYSYGDVKLGQGASNVTSLLEDNPELEEEIRNKVNEERNKQHSEVEVQEF